MKNFLSKLKKLFSPLAVVSIASGVITMISFLFFSKDEQKGESALFMLILFLFLLIVGTLAIYLLTDPYSGNSLGEGQRKKLTEALLTGMRQPVLACRENGQILWVNKAFFRASGNKEVVGQNTSLYFAAMPSLLSDGIHFPDGVIVPLGEKQFNVRCYKAVETEEKEPCFITVWEDLTVLYELQEKYEADAPMIAYIVIDNLDEILRFAEGNYRTVASQIDEVLEEWAKECHGVLKEYEKDKYFFIFHASELTKLIENKFEILDKIREVRVGENNIPVTVSIGIGNVSGRLEERAAASISALETALQRGGDQAVLKNEKQIEIYGGKTKTVQKKTKVRARVVATELMDRICKAENVLIMGHRFADFDAFGACIGVARMCLTGGVPFNIVSNLQDASLQKCFKKAYDIPGYTKNVFIDSATAQERLSTNTLLIIVDVNNPNQFESPELAKNALNIVCIDHHRKTVEFEVSPKISYIDPSASSACELIADMLEQSIPAGSLSKDEAELMLAGIVLDTKKYEINTGTKTFGAAQYLKSEGADPGDVQKLFITNFDDFQREAGFGAKITVYKDRYAISVNEHSDDSPANRVAAAKAADKLLDIEGVEASFALCPIGDSVRISGRSNGKINVQLIMERIGGGGRFDAAAAEISSAMLTEALLRLKASIDETEAELASKDDKENDSHK